MSNFIPGSESGKEQPGGQCNGATWGRIFGGAEGGAARVDGPPKREGLPERWMRLDHLKILG